MKLESLADRGAGRRVDLRGGCLDRKLLPNRVVVELGRGSDRLGFVNVRLRPICPTRTV